MIMFCCLRVIIRNTKNDGQIDKELGTDKILHTYPNWSLIYQDLTLQLHIMSVVICFCLAEL